jgi:hypothetical protein
LYGWCTGATPTGPARSGASPEGNPSGASVQYSPPTSSWLSTFSRLRSGVGARVRARIEAARPERPGRENEPCALPASGR